MIRGLATIPRYTHSLQRGLAVIRNTARLWRAPAGSRCAFCTGIPEGRGTSSYSSSANTGPAAPNPGGMPCIPGHIHPQGSPGFNPRIPAAERHTPRFGTPYNYPHKLIDRTDKTLKLFMRGR